ncbi:hypothetical protein [Armatimonas sp.]|uniref:hypothetical protein n=1 Tax=Armatimonas sp. TaxID=1872638 RepID=UPI0037534BB1
MQKDEHNHSEVRQSKAVPGYHPAQSVTRYEAVVLLFEMLAHVEASVAQPRRSKHEIQPGRKSNLGLNPTKAKNYTDVPGNHWASKSLVGLSIRGVSLVEGTRFSGEQAVTGNELARWAEGFSAWIEGRPATAKSVAGLVQVGYLPQTSPLVKKADKPVSAQEMTQLLVGMIARSLEKVTTMSPDSRFAK